MLLHHMTSEPECMDMQARTQAEDMLKICLHTSEELVMDSIWAVVDSYKYAIVITRELDIESEVMALSG